MTWAGAAHGTVQGDRAGRGNGSWRELTRGGGSESDRLWTARRAALAADRVGAGTPDAAAPVPAHRDRERRGFAGRHDRRAGLVERGPVLIPDLLGDRAVGPDRQRGRGRRSARLGQLRADGVLLPGRRARGAPRVRHGRAARTAGAPPSGAGAGWRG